jgi:hypothetical protein
MDRISVLILLLAILHCAAQAEEIKTADADIEELIKQLSSDDFATRTKATEALASRAERIWSRLEQLARSKDLEISQRAKIAMSLPGQRELQAEIETAKRKRAAIDEEVKNSEATLNRKVREQNEKVLNAEEETKKLVEQLEKLPEPEAAEKKKQLAAKREADAVLFNLLTELHQQVDSVRKKYRTDCNRLDTRLIQLSKLAESGDILKPGAAATWTPAEWPFERRFSVSVSFEFADLDLCDAVAFISDAAKIPIKLDSSAIKAGRDKAAITLRVQDMNADLALQWISRLAELEVSIDDEKGSIILTPSKEP